LLVTPLEPFHRAPFGPRLGVVVEPVDDLDAPIAQRRKPDEAFACVDRCDLCDRSDREAVLAARSCSRRPTAAGALG